MNSRLICIAAVLLGLCGSAQAGVIEICKDSDPAGALSGLYGFTIAGQAGTILVPVGACTDSFLLPDGLAVITEVLSPDSFLENVFTFPDDRLISFDPRTASATVLIVPGDLSDPSNETVVDFLNAPVAVSSVPEPGTGWAIGTGLTLWALRRRFFPGR
jgi:hypothetical protein